MSDAGKRLIAAAKEAGQIALRAHRDALEAERDALLIKNAALTAERDALRAKLEVPADEALDDWERDLRSGMGFAPLALMQTADVITALRARVAELEAGQTEAAAAGFRRGVEAAAKVVEIDRNAYRLIGTVGVAEALTVAATAIRATLSEPRT